MLLLALYSRSIFWMDTGKYYNSSHSWDVSAAMLVKIKKKKKKWGNKTLVVDSKLWLWQVNESELERTLGEVEHRRTSMLYHEAEMRVQHLQKDLKRSIAKSRWENTTPP